MGVVIETVPKRSNNLNPVEAGFFFTAWYNRYLMPEKILKRKKIEERMKNLDKNSQAYQSYADMLRSPELQVERPQVVLHKDDGAGVCESCQ